jgi:type I restriction-modification system DNA methylase subunit
MSYDWFHQYFADEHADRKNNKQDFTPPSIARLVSEIMKSDTGITYEPAAGTGGMLIVNWYNHREKISLFDYKPNSHLIVCHELSDKAVPFLLLNLSIRGISGIVFHGNSLKKEIKSTFIIVNERNSPVHFSNIYKL